MPGGALAPIFGGLLGSGAGAGMSLMMVLSGVLALTSSLMVYFIPAIWNLEEDLPDYIPDDYSADDCIADEPTQSQPKEVDSKGEKPVAKPVPAN